MEVAPESAALTASEPAFSRLKVLAVETAGMAPGALACNGSSLAVATANDMPQRDGEITLGAPADGVLERVALRDQRVSLESAACVLGGGRGLDAEGFAMLEQISDAVGGAVGASLAAVGLGLAPVSLDL